MCLLINRSFTTGEEQAWAKAIASAAPGEDSKDTLSPINSKISTAVSYQTISKSGSDTDAPHDNSTVTIENTDHSEQEENK